MEDSFEGSEGNDYAEKYAPYDEEKEDRIEAPVLLIKKVFKTRREILIEKVETAFREAGREQVQVLELYLTTNSTKDHAYMLLNSKSASDLLLDGTVNISVPVENDEGVVDEIVLWFDEADHLEPKEHQEPNVLFIRNLPTNRPALQVAQELRLKIFKWCPIEDIDVPSDRSGKGTCVGTAKIYLETEFDTRKCIYLLNHSMFLGEEILASFSNRDRQYSKPKIPRPVPREEPVVVATEAPRQEIKPKEKPSLDSLKFRSKRNEPKKLSPDNIVSLEEKNTIKKTSNERNEDSGWTIVSKKR
jgi:hypothetical protein